MVVHAPALNRGGRASSPGGYRHVIEQATDDFVPVPAIMAGDSGLSFGFTFDPGIETEEGIACIRSQRSFFQLQGALLRSERSTKKQIEDAFRAENSCR